MFSSVIELISSVVSTDDYGFEIRKQEKREVFANKKSIRASEHYEAQKLGYKLSAMFEIKPYEYDNEEYLFFENEQYKIERTYEKNSEILELVCRKEDLSGC